jgi:hypothetical protein
VLGADANTNNAKANEMSAESQQSLRAYLQLQEKIHETMLTMETNHSQVTNDIQRSAVVFSSRLSSLEKALSEQRDASTDAMQKSNRIK